MATPNFAAVNELAEPALALAVSPITHAHHRTRRKTTIQIADNEENHEVNLLFLTYMRLAIASTFRGLAIHLQLASKSEDMCSVASMQCRLAVCS